MRAEQLWGPNKTVSNLTGDGRQRQRLYTGHSYIQATEAQCTSQHSTEGTRNHQKRRKINQAVHVLSCTPNNKKGYTTNRRRRDEPPIQGRARKTKRSGGAALA